LVTQRATTPRRARTHHRRLLAERGDWQERWLLLLSSRLRHSPRPHSGIHLGHNFCRIGNPCRRGSHGLDVARSTLTSVASFAPLQLWPGVAAVVAMHAQGRDVCPLLISDSGSIVSLWLRCRCLVRPGFQTRALSTQGELDIPAEFQRARFTTLPRDRVILLLAP
jgi:hypothetical protein